MWCKTVMLPQLFDLHAISQNQVFCTAFCLQLTYVVYLCCLLLTASSLSSHPNSALMHLYTIIGSVSPSFCATVSASINVYPATDCAAATDISCVSGRSQLSR